MVSSSNPVFSDKIFTNQRVVSGGVMTIDGTINKTLILLLFVGITGYYTWNLFVTGHAAQASGLGVVGAILGLVFALITCFKQQWAHITAPVYAACEGLLLGGISAMFEQQYPGIAMQAVSLTFMALLGMLLLYKNGIIRATEKFRSVLMISMFSIMGIYLVDFIGSFFHFSIPLISGSGPVGIGFSLVVVVIASLNFILDFDTIEQGVNYGMPAQMEWIGSFGLLVTMVWVYIELLKLLSKLRSRED